jgi:hypothetical protein
MSKKILTEIPDIENIPENKTFDELTESEKAKVLELMSINEYNLYRNTILRSKLLFSQETEAISPDPSIKDKLMLEFRNKNSIKGKNFFHKLNQIINYKIPIYKIGFAFSVIIAFTLFFRQWNNESLKYINITDTVYVEKIVKQNKADSGLIEKPAFGNKSNKTLKMDTSQNDFQKNNYIKSETVYERHSYENFTIENTMKNIEIIDKMKKGRSIDEDSLLLKFLVQAVSI